MCQRLRKQQVSDRGMLEDRFSLHSDFVERMAQLARGLRWAPVIPDITVVGAVSVDANKEDLSPVQRENGIALAVKLQL